MKKENGFTLVELLAVIVIIAIILAIAIPTISNYKEERKKNLFFALAKNIIRELNYENMETNSSLFNILGSLEMELSEDQVDLNKSYILTSEDGVVLNIFGKGIYNGLYLCDVSSSTISANYEDTTCVDGNYKSIVTLDASGGVVEPTTLEVTAGNEYGELPTPTKENSNFIGWYYNGTKIESNTKVTAIVNHTLVAKWKYNAKLTIILNGGTLNQSFEERYLEGTSLILDSPTKEENTFVGWKITNGNGIISGNNLIFGDTDIIIEAQFRINKIELVVDFDGGTDINPSGNYDIGSSIQITPPTKPGYAFAGWEIVSGDSIISGNTITIGNQPTTIKAIYTVNKYVVIFDPQGGEVANNTLEVTYNTPYGTLPIPTKKHSIFQGWYTEKENGNKIESTDIVKITNSQILYAHWEDATLAYEEVISNYSCANSYAGEAVDRIFSYSGNCQILQDSNGWRIKFLSSGTLRFYVNSKIDAFVVGGGTAGGTGYKHVADNPGKGGEAVLSSGINLTKNEDYTVVVGEPSKDSSFIDVVATAGGTTVDAGQCEFLEEKDNSCVFADNNYKGHYGANGHQTTYGGGRGASGGNCYGATVISSTAGAANTGAGGGSGNRWEAACDDGTGYKYGFGGLGSSGGSGVVIIRNAR